MESHMNIELEMKRKEELCIPNKNNELCSPLRRPGRFNYSLHNSHAKVLIREGDGIKMVERKEETHHSPKSKPMTGFGSPCGACKFLRRKCVRGCVFAPYFCYDQGATQFASIHKVFGASNVSKLLMQIPVNDRYEAAVTISYEAQARLQDPVYGCVSHIFALQQQVVNLQSQLTSLKAQAAIQDFGSVSSTTSSLQLQEERLYNKLSPYQQDLLRTQTSMPNASNGEYRMNYENDLFESNCVFGSSQDSMPCSNLSYKHISVSTNYSSSCGMEEDLQSYAYLHHT